MPETNQSWWTVFAGQFTRGQPLTLIFAGYLFHETFALPPLPPKASAFEHGIPAADSTGYSVRLERIGESGG